VFASELFIPTPIFLFSITDPPSRFELSTFATLFCSAGLLSVTLDALARGGKDGITECCYAAEHPVH
jgi:hypothetical protein